MPDASTPTPTSSPPEANRYGSEVIMNTSREMWASLAIAVMWLAVALCALFAPDFVSTTPGGNTTTIPSGIAVAVFALIGTSIVAKRGFAQRDRDPR
jgi:hypothetical protein